MDECNWLMMDGWISTWGRVPPVSLAALWLLPRPPTSSEDFLRDPEKLRLRHTLKKCTPHTHTLMQSRTAESFLLLINPQKDTGCVFPDFIFRTWTWNATICESDLFQIPHPVKYSNTPIKNSQNSDQSEWTARWDAFQTSHSHVYRITHRCFSRMDSKPTIITVLVESVTSSPIAWSSSIS